MTAQPTSRLDAVIGEVLRAATDAGAGAEASRVAAMVAQTQGPATVVVAGERGRGKSALVNVLAGHPGLLPVDLEVATNAHVAVHWAESPRAVVVYDDRADEIDVTDVDSYASERGNPGNRKGVRGVHVGVPSPLLAEGVVLVDTPGVGGLDSGHAQLSLAALGGADGLVVVTDASAPLSAPELDFLRRGAGVAPAALVAVTKIDQYPGWREILEANRRLVAQVAASPVVGVSSRVGVRALELREVDPALADELGAESGMDDLIALLRAQVLARTKALRDRRRLRTTRDLVATVVERATSSGVAARRVALERVSAGVLAARIGQAVQVIAVEARGELSRALQEVRRRAETRAASDPKRAGEAVEQARDELVAASLAVSVHLDQQLVEAARAIASEMGIAPPDPVRRPTGVKVDLGPVEAAPLAPDASPALEAVGAVMSGFALQHMATLTLGAALGTVALPLGAAAGLVVAGLRRRQGDRARSHAEARAQIAALAATATSQLHPVLEKQVITGRQHLEQVLRAEIDHELAALRSAGGVELSKEALDTLVRLGVELDNIVAELDAID